MKTKILVSQPTPQTAKSPYFTLAEKYDLDIVFRPFIKIEPIEMKAFRAQHINILDFTAVVFTSRHAIDHFFRICTEMKVKVPETMKYFCKSEQIALYIQKYVQYRKRKIFFAETGIVYDLVPLMVKHSAERYLVPQSSVHTNDLKKMLDDAEIDHTEAVMYHTVSNEFSKDEPMDYNLIVFFSPEGINSLTKNFPRFKQKNISIACLGSKTLEAATKAGLQVDIVPSAELRSVPSMIEYFVKHREELAKKKRPAAKKTTSKKKPATKKTTATKSATKKTAETKPATKKPETKKPVAKTPVKKNGASKK